jgi:putative transposase
LASRPWQELRGQIYLGSEEFVEERSAKNLESKEIPRAQLHVPKPPERIFARQGEKGIVRAYKEHGYRIREIAAHLGVHYATVSQRLKQLEQAK